MLYPKDSDCFSHLLSMNQGGKFTNSISETFISNLDTLDTLSEISTMSTASQIALEYALNHYRCAIDIGGTLAKLVYLEPLEKSQPSHIFTLQSSHQSSQQTSLLGTDCTDDDYHLYLAYEKAKYSETYEKRKNLAKISIQVSKTEMLRFEYFHSQDIQSLINFILVNKLAPEGSTLNITGGGAYKFAEIISNQLKVDLKKKDEMNSIMRGLNLLLTLKNSVFRYDFEKKYRIPVTLSYPIYPFLVVNIGSGVSILKVNSETDFTRVTGTCVGGGTVLGLAKLIFGAKSFHEVATLSELGGDDLDLTVGELFGDSLQNHSLSLSTFASSFGKISTLDESLRGDKLKQKIKKSDIARSLIRMVSYNIGYLAYLVGSLHNIHRVFFAGKYIDNHSFTMESISYGVNFYDSSYSPPFSYYQGLLDFNNNNFDHFPQPFPEPSKNKNIQENSHDNPFALVEAELPFEVYFLKHDGYLGALGSFLS